MFLIKGYIRSFLNDLKGKVFQEKVVSVALTDDYVAVSFFYVTFQLLQKNVKISEFLLSSKDLSQIYECVFFTIYIRTPELLFC